MLLRFTQLLRQFVVVFSEKKKRLWSLHVKLLRQCEEKIHLSPLSSVVVRVINNQWKWWPRAHERILTLHLLEYKALLKAQSYFESTSGSALDKMTWQWMNSKLNEKKNLNAVILVWKANLLRNKTKKGVVTLFSLFWVCFSLLWENNSRLWEQRQKCEIKGWF